jgi:hypothetical protein
VDVASWLRDLGLERYEATFRENDLDAELLPNLTADDLKDLGITSLGHRLRLLEAIAKSTHIRHIDSAQLVSSILGIPCMGSSSVSCSASCTAGARSFG